ncbi:hypothetical protein UCMB321_5037 [Pseudomonas batumici]|uniref:Uncharacterized protein n=1 Tax=Pseudomonas batumici TaxID=226910 RepID=A0A0C2HVQ4_9PSED|nr:hypothetical protein UCMB321_5037 [Pseudomonas batumici]
MGSRPPGDIKTPEKTPALRGIAPKPARKDRLRLRGVSAPQVRCFFGGRFSANCM